MSFKSKSYSVMGDEDRREFQFNKPVSDGELIELLERNCRISMQCDWMTAIALKNGFNLPAGSDDHLAQIHFKEKLHRAIMFGRLHGSSMAKKYDIPIANVTDEEGNILEETKTANFEVYHKKGATLGWFIKPSDIGEDGQPLSYQLAIAIADGKQKQEKVMASECIIFKNPKKGQCWDGTASSKLVAHSAILEELLLKITGKHSIDVAGSFLHFDGVQSNEQAADIHAALEERPISELYTNGVTIAPMMNDVKGSIKELEIFSNMLKDYMACAMRVSRQSMDGAAEGTLSSAEYNTIMTSDTIQGIQEHYTPYIINLLTLLGYPNHKLVWNKPIEKLEDKPEKDKPDTDTNESTDESED